MTKYCRRSELLSNLFSKDREFFHCNNIFELIHMLVGKYDPSDWRLFIDSSKKSIKALPLHIGNLSPSGLIAYSTTMKETFQNLQFMLEKSVTLSISGLYAQTRKLQQSLQDFSWVTPNIAAFYAYRTQEQEVNIMPESSGLPDWYHSPVSIRSEKNLKNDDKKASGCSNRRWESVTSWFDLKDNSDDEEIIENEDFVDGQSRLRDMLTLLLLSATRPQVQTMKWLSVVDKKVIAETPLSMAVMVLQSEARLQKKMVVCGLPPAPHRQQHEHVTLDTPTKCQLMLQKKFKIKLTLLTLLMKICSSRLSNTLTSVQEGTGV